MIRSLAIIGLTALAIRQAQVSLYFIHQNKILSGDRAALQMELTEVSNTAAIARGAADYAAERYVVITLENEALKASLERLINAVEGKP